MRLMASPKQCDSPFPIVREDERNTFYWSGRHLGVEFRSSCWRMVQANFQLLLRDLVRRVLTEYRPLKMCSMTPPLRPFLADLDQ